MKYVEALFQVETRTHHEPEINCRISTPLIHENVYSQRNSLWYALSHSSSKGKTSCWIMQHTKIQSYSTQKITPNSFLCISACLVRFVQRLSATIAYTSLMGLSNIFAASPFKSNWLTPTCPWELRYRCRGSYGAEMIVLWLYAISLKRQRLKLASFSTKSPHKILTGRCCM